MHIQMQICHGTEYGMWIPIISISISNSSFRKDWVTSHSMYPCQSLSACGHHQQWGSVNVICVMYFSLLCMYCYRLKKHTHYACTVCMKWYTQYLYKIICREPKWIITHSASTQKLDEHTITIETKTSGWAMLLGVTSLISRSCKLSCSSKNTNYCFSRCWVKLNLEQYLSCSQIMNQNYQENMTR